MPLQNLNNFDPNYRESFGDNDIKGRTVYSEAGDKIGTISDVLVDEQGNFRYFVVDLGFWIFGKKVLLPVGRSRIDENADRVYALGMTREQAENLPEFNERSTPDYDYEERVRGVYRPQASTAAATPAPTNTNYDRDSYTYQQEPSLYDINDRDNQTLKLYQERLIANKNRVKTGEVTVGKRIETETAQVSVPLEKERVIIERVTPADAGTPVAPGTVDFHEGEVARMEIYEETPDIRKETVVREEVRVRKEVQRDTVEAQETLRREELDVNTEGRPVVEDASNPIANPKDRI
jgi:uncharacterized protein (TIGR02271 family)